MKSLKIACTERTRSYFFTDRETIEVGTTDYTDVAVAVVNESDIEGINDIYNTKFGVSIFVLKETENISDEIKDKVNKIININEINEEEFSKELNEAADKYEEEMLPPFFDVLSKYSRRGNLQFSCPGHQGGQYFMKHPAGRAMYEYFGENIFKSDICNADVDLGDLLIHEGPAMSAQTYAAKVYNADKTYFVMNGTSTSNSVVINAIVSPGDLVLFDRNNHKSIYNSALVSSAGKPIYLETARNPFGFIGGIDAHCFNEEYLRSEAAKIDSEKAKEKRPFRLAVIQLGTYDGTIYNARQVVNKIGHLCDYILFDSAWVGYEQFIPMMRECSPLLLDLKPEDPGILVTQSIHKQQAGFSQTSQIHKKDSHLKGQKRYVDHKRFNNAYMLYASTSPFYPLFAALDVAIKAAEEKIREENFENKYTEASKTALRENLENAKLAKENANLSVEDVKLVVDALNASIEELQLKAVVTINNNDQIETKYCEIGEQVRVVAQTVKDKKFSHWTFNGTPICYSSPYTFTVYGDTTIEAVYVDAGEEVTPQAAMLCSVSYNKSTQTIKYTAKRSVPEGCKIVKHGMILTSKPAWEALYKDNQEAFKLEADRIITKVATTTGLAGNYSVSVKCTKPNIWYAKGYVVYTDKNGEEQTVYSDVVSYEVK